MAGLQTTEAPARAGECRSCGTYCDKLIEPRDCLRMRCPYLWSYIDGFEGKRYMGCIRRVFKGEIEIGAFEAAERLGGFGGIKMTGEPLPHCQFRVEPAYEGDGPAFECSNPSFFDCTDPADFDLRTYL